MDRSDLDNRFVYHPPVTAERKSQHERMRTEFREMAFFVNDYLPEGREKALVVTKLEEAMFWANAALARQE